MNRKRFDSVRVLWVLWVLVLGAWLVGASAAVAAPLMYLPFQYSTQVRVVQGNNGSYSHTGNLAYAYDIDLGYGVNAFGTGLYSPAEAEVMDARDGAPDYSLNTSSCQANNNGWGNTVLLRDLATNYYIRMAHMRNGSISVSVGSIVKLGQKIGEIGQSGISTGPHLHIHVQETSGWSDPSVPVYFVEGYLQQGAVVKSELETDSFVLDDSGMKSMSHKASKFTTARNSGWKTYLNTTPNYGAGLTYGLCSNGYVTPYMKWKFRLNTGGFYLVYARYAASSSNEPSAKYTVGGQRVYLNQQTSQPDNWGFLMGMYIYQGTDYEIRADGTTMYKYLFGDGLKFRKLY